MECFSSNRDIYKVFHCWSVNHSTGDTFSPLHLFFRDYTGTITTIILITTCYFVIVLPSSWTQWLQPFLQLHGSTLTDTAVLYKKDMKDICTLTSLVLLLIVIRDFLCNTLFKHIAHWLKIQNTPEKPQSIHKCEEQSWLVLYYVFSFSTGLTLIRKYIGFRLNNVWEDYPVLLLPWDYKLFYMVQCAFYFQAIILLFIEVCSNFQGTV